MIKKFNSFIAICFAITYLSACSTVKHHGYKVQETKVAEIKTGETTKKDVKKLMGSPTTYSQNDNNTWYYIGKQNTQFAFLQPERVGDQIIKIQFDENGVVSNLEKKNFKKDVNIEVVSEETPTFGNEASIIEQLLGNIGRFNNTKNRK